MSKLTQKQALAATLDAYGHMTWTVGNEDWQACFDAARKGKWIAYQVVVNCESGGFVDTMEQDVVPATEEAMTNLRRFPDYWASICMEHYIDDDEYGTPDAADIDATIVAWNAHLDALLKGTR